MTESSGTRNIMVAGLVVSIVVLAVGIALALWESMGPAADMWNHHGMGIPFPMGMYFIVFGGILLVILLVLAISQPSSAQRPVAPHVPIAPYRKRDDWTPEMQNLALRLLPGDERRMLRHVFDAGGQILQKDLVNQVGFSKAKVTRLLDKLERRGLIVRERHGSTNLVRVSKDLGGRNDGISEK